MMKLKFFFFAVSLALLFASCSSDDDATPVVDPVSAFVGTWKLTSASGTLPLDLDMDGTASTNLLEELTCFDDTIVVSADNTYTQDVTEIDVELIPGFPPVVNASCTGVVLNETGMWDLVGDQLTFTPAEMDSRTVTVVLSETTLSFIDIDDDLGAIALVFTKQ